MSTYTFRLCEQKDAEWMTAALANPQISTEEVRAGSKDASPLVTYWMVECDGRPIVFAPLVPYWAFAHLGFSDDSSAEERKQALQTLVAGVASLALSVGVRELTALTLPEFPVAQYACSQLGFEWESRKLIRRDLNKPFPKQS